MLSLDIKNYHFFFLPNDIGSIDDGDEWISSDDTISDLDADDYTIIFKRVSGWRKTKSQTVSIEEGEDSSITGTYRVSQGTATLIVDINLHR